MSESDWVKTARHALYLWFAVIVIIEVAVMFLLAAHFGWVK